MWEGVGPPRTRSSQDKALFIPPLPLIFSLKTEMDFKKKKKKKRAQDTHIVTAKTETRSRGEHSKHKSNVGLHIASLRRRQHLLSSVHHQG